MSRVMVDDDGVGGGVVDFLNCVPFNGGLPADKVDGKPELYADLRSQGYYKLAQVVNDRDLFIETQAYREEIEREVILIRKAKANRRGLLCVQKKEDVIERLGHSPDFSDVMMMRMRFEHIATTDAVDGIRKTLEKRAEVRLKAALAAQSSSVRKPQVRGGSFDGR